MPEGYVEPNSSNGFNYVYQFKDHLDNVRLSYTKNDAGNLEIIEEKNYYPFGLTHKGYNNIVSSYGNSTAQLIGFGNKEEQTELGLGWIDITARNYNPELGRWFVIDPLADAKGQIHNSPFAYAMNNPIYFIDPDGNCPLGIDCARAIVFFQKAAVAIDNFLENNELIFDMDFGADFNLGVGVTANINKTKLDLNAKLLNVKLFNVEGSLIKGKESFKTDYAGKNGKLNVKQSIKGSFTNSEGTQFSIVDGENSFTAYDDYERTTNRVQKLDFFNKEVENELGNLKVDNVFDNSNSTTTIGNTEVNTTSGGSNVSATTSSTDNSSTLKIGGKVSTGVFSVKTNINVGFKSKIK